MIPTTIAIWSSSDLPYACLKDRERTLAFRRAIARQVRSGDVVVDAGAGTGILSFFAASAGASTVYAVEIDPLLVACLRRSVALNRLEDRIIVVEGDAATAELPSAVDVVIGELIETGLLDEPQIAVLNSLHARGVIGPRTRLIPSGYVTSIELVAVETTFYGFAVAAPLHEWPNYGSGEPGWLPTIVRPLTDRQAIVAVDFSRLVEPDVDRTSRLMGIADGIADGIRLSGVARLAPGLELGATNTLNGDKILRLTEPVSVQTGALVTGQVCFRMGDGLGTFAWRQEQ